jgi:hypothetical protein
MRGLLRSINRHRWATSLASNFVMVLAAGFAVYWLKFVPPAARGTWPPEYRESHEEASETPESPSHSDDAPPEASVEAQETTERPDSEATRSWWRRMFGI